MPTDETRALVVRLVGEDRPVDAIAIALNISAPTLRAHYAAELSAPRPQLDLGIAPKARPQSRRRPAAPDRGGRPQHVPTPETRGKVEVLLAGGMMAWQIAMAIGVSEPTLREHYGDQLSAGKARKRAEVILAMHKEAISGNVSAQKGFLALQTLDIPPDKGERDPPSAPVGKKEQAAMNAWSASEGTGWDKLLPN